MCCYSYSDVYIKVSETVRINGEHISVKIHPESRFSRFASIHTISSVANDKNLFGRFTHLYVKISIIIALRPNWEPTGDVKSRIIINVFKKISVWIFYVDRDNFRARN